MILKKIYINGRFLGQRITGIQRYSREMLFALDDLLDSSSVGFQYFLVCPPEVKPIDLKVIRQIWVGSSSGHRWEQTSLLFSTLDGLLLSFGSTGPILHPRQVITVHDASIYRVPDAFDWKFRLWYKICMNWLVRKNKLTLVVSNFAKSECIRYFGGDASKIVVTSEGWQHLSGVIDGADSGLPSDFLGKKFYLAVSSPTPNKNFKLIGEAVEGIGEKNLSFAIAGGSNTKVFSEAKTASGSNHSIEYLGYVSDADLLRLYSSAYAFVFPSRYEGFGIPPLEAMSMGCPVLAAKIDSVVEVCGDAALYFDPYDASTLREALLSIDQDPVLRDTLATKSKERASLFTWASAAQVARESIEKVLA